MLGEPTFLPTVTLLLAVLILVTGYFQCRSRRLPPGPPGLPFVGNLFSVKREFYFSDCIRWAKLYGPVLRLKLAATNVIVLTDEASIQKCLCKKVVLSRPSQWTVEDKNAGFVGLNGHLWWENRRLCMQLLNDLGYGKAPMHAQIQEEVQHLVAKIAEHGGVPVVARDLLMSSVLNNLLFYTTGSRYDLDDPRREQLDRIITGFFHASVDFSIEYLPAWMRRLSHRLFSTARCTALSRRIEELTKHMSSEVDEYLKTPESQRQRSLVDSFMREAQRRENDSECITMGHMVGNICDLLVAGTVTTVVTLHWHLLQLASDPDGLQARLQCEIDAAVGRERPPSWEDRTRLPLTMATMWEMYRWRLATPLGLPRQATEDTYLGDHFVPKGSVILANFWAANMNAMRWEQPEKFDPTRFLKPDGPAPATRPSSVHVFSVGKRMCPGEAMANAEVFLYVTSLLQRFRISPEEGRSTDISKPCITPGQVPLVKLRFVPR
ncbi:cytochrome P450 2J4-like [Amblyomma americanum]